MYDPAEPGNRYDQTFPPKPEIVDADLWDELIRRGDFHYPRPDPDVLGW